MTGNPARKRSILGFTGIALGAIALLIALVQFWIGPFDSPQHGDAGHALHLGHFSITLHHDAPGEKPGLPASIDPDQAMHILIAVLAGLGIILAVLGFVRRESLRVVGAAVVLGVVAVVIQYFMMVAAAVLAILLIGAILGSLGFS